MSEKEYTAKIWRKKIKNDRELAKNFERVMKYGVSAKDWEELFHRSEMKKLYTVSLEELER